MGPEDGIDGGRERVDELRPARIPHPERALSHFPKPDVSGLLLQLGIALLMSNLRILLLVPVSKIVFDRDVIAREEACLERAYGEVYPNYRRTVRRWL